MKTIIYILIACMVAGIFLPAIPFAHRNTGTTITIQSAETNIDAQQLNQSAQIIAYRLETFGLDSFKIFVSEEESVIQVQLKGGEELLRVQSLLTNKGEIEFFETVERSEILKKVKSSDSLFEILSIPTTLRQEKYLKSEAVLGTCKANEKQRVEEYLYSSNFMEKMERSLKFAWGEAGLSSSDYFLYTIGSEPVMDKSSINECVGKYSEDIDMAEIIFKFNEEGAENWEYLTTKNLGKSLAIVLDNKVLYAPKVSSIISEGQCRLTGNFTKDETNTLLALINCGTLPVKFTVMK